MYIELHAHSHFSLLDGVPSPEALVQHAARLEMPALALTDHDALYGAVPFAKAAEAAGIKPIFGAEMTLTNGGHLTLLAENDTGYKNLCRLITLARRDQEKGVAALAWPALANHATGLIAFSGCQRGEIAQALLETNLDRATRIADRYRSIFGQQNFFLELQRHHQHGDRRIDAGLNIVAARLGLRQIATGNVHYLAREQAALHDVLTCIRHLVPLHQAGSLLRPNNEFFFRSPAEMMALFVEWPDALQATHDVAERCHAQLPMQPQAFPTIDIPPGLTPAQYLRRLCAEGLPRKCGGHDLTAYQATLERELAIIFEQGLTNYFLIVWDIMRFARSRHILCQGRGSAANSLVAFLLDITSVDPLTAGLVFERFLSRERLTPPDIDLDFARLGREEVIRYIYQRYGHEHVAMACTLNTFGARSALRDVGMAFGFAKQTLKEIAAQIGEDAGSVLAESPRLRAAFGEQVDTPRWQQLLTYASAIDLFPRHLGIHVGGMIISEQPLIERIPIEPARKADIFVTQWDKDALEGSSHVKVDVLSLASEEAMSDACEFVAQQTGHYPDLNALRFDDPAVYDMINRLETIGVFQIESRAQISLIPRFKTRSLSDLTIQIALIRPGPVQGNMVNPYIERRAGRQPVTYLHPLLKPALEETLGIILFQEQVIKVARDLAGFSPGEGELLRRALGHKRATEKIDAFRDRFLAGAQAKDVPPAIASKVFDQLRAFGSFSFAKSHAASFAVLTYWSAWLRCHYPAAFFAGILRNEPLGFYDPHVVVSEAQRTGVKVLPADLRYSPGRTTLEGDAVRLGLDYVQGLGPAQIEIVEAERQRRAFNSLADLVKRTGLDCRRVEALVLAGAVNHFSDQADPDYVQRQLLWDIAEAYRMAKRPPEFPLHSPDEEVSLAPLDTAARLEHAFAFTGVTLDAHLTNLRRDAFTKAGARSISDLWKMWSGRQVKVGGLVVARQHPPSAKGVCFLAVEDTDGMINVVVRPDVYEAYRDEIRAFVIIEGTLEREGGGKAVYIVATKITAV